MSLLNNDKNVWSMEEAFIQMLEDNHLKDKFIEQKIQNVFQEIVGKTISKYASKIVLKDKKLYISINSPIVKNELRMLKEQLLEKIHEKIDKRYITDVVIK